MTKQVSFSATVSALTMTVFALTVAVGNFHDARQNNAASSAVISISAHAD
ncbi:hypothetical protein HKD42_08780 [Altererythrobacter sp. RZ02]|uniref:Uncharacterized protein n=1 Tax=Pontixanthobacter rizhaonensis TaxID=2730337 RepID=A0A848QN91_9SPHN|nr:hypothetical protein [Pontixanthobacter rizhaonensis]NMW32153.1 hypothetical protein [Pontixanthobacter rizhaonensis]